MAMMIRLLLLLFMLCCSAELEGFQRKSSNVAVELLPRSYLSALDANAPASSVNFVAYAAGIESTANRRLTDVLVRAQEAAFRGGFFAALASIIQVLSLMWLKTTVSYQYRYGGTLKGSLVHLFKQGGILRFYKGLPYAIVLGPLAKFGSTAANEGSRIIIASHFADSRIDHYMLASAMGTGLSICWRIFLMPLETCKTVLQVDGNVGFDRLMHNVAKGHFGVLYRGSSAAALMILFSHYPWFYVYNWLDTTLPKPDIVVEVVLRSAFIGFVASVTSDACSNFLRILKTIKQTTSSLPTTAVAVKNTTATTVYKSGRESGKDREGGGEIDAGCTKKSNCSGSHGFTYSQIIRQIHSEGGMHAVLGRGLGTRILTNGIQNVLFTVVWKLIPHILNHSTMNRL